VQEAATKACFAVKDGIAANIKNVTSVKKAGELLLNCFELADFKIREGKDPWEVATTSLIAGLLVTLEEDQASMNLTSPKIKHTFRKSLTPPNSYSIHKKKEKCRRGFVCCSLGSCSAYLYEKRTKEVLEITPNYKTKKPKRSGGTARALR